MMMYVFVWFLSSTHVSRGSRRIEAHEVSDVEQTADSWNVNAFLYSWKENAAGYMGVARAAPIFDDNPEMYTIEEKNSQIDKSYWSDSATARASSYKTALGLNTSSMFLDTTFQAEYEIQGSSKTRLYKDESLSWKSKALVSWSSSAYFQPHKYLNHAFMDLVNRSSPDKIQRDFGDFWCKSVRLGGHVRRTIDLRTSSSMSSSEISSEVSASYDSLTWEAGGTVAVDTSNSNLESDATMTTDFKVEGPGSSYYSGTDASDWNAWKEGWSASVDKAAKSDMVPSEFELKPLWDLVWYFNPSKAEEMQKWYENEMWKKGVIAFQITHWSGLCMSAGNNPGQSQKVRLSTMCTAEWEAYPVSEDQGQGKYYIFKHKDGKCLHPYGGWEHPGDGTSLTVYSDCTHSKKSLQWAPYCVPGKPGWYVLQMYGSACMRQDDGAKDGARFMTHHNGCNPQQNDFSKTDYYLQGNGFGNDPPC